MSKETSFSHRSLSGLVTRSRLLATLDAHRGTPDVKVLIGVRRCGKSSLMRLFADQLLEEGVPLENVFFKRLDDFDVPIGYDAVQLLADLQNAAAAVQSTYPLYVFLDEVQVVDGWEQVVRRLHTRENTDVYITGSNAQVLSGDLATHLTGRYIEVPVFPLSFAEYCEFEAATGGGSASLVDELAAYLRFGGMPGLFALTHRTEETVRPALRAVYQSVVLTDVAQRYGIRDLSTLEKVSRYLFAKSGNLFSVRNVANSLKSAGVHTSVTAVDNQIRALEHAFIVHRADQVGIRGKQILRPRSKYYPVDNGFRNLAAGFASQDIGSQLEGVVFMELRRRGWTVGVGTDGVTEVDFVATKGFRKQYVQATASMLDEATRERELRPLRSLDDAFPRIVVTLDAYGGGTTDEGIVIANAAEWLLGEW